MEGSMNFLRSILTEGQLGAAIAAGPFLALAVVGFLAETARQIEVARAPEPQAVAAVQIERVR
jgi:hypothetical protein